MSDDFMDLLSGKSDDDDKKGQGPGDLLGGLMGGGAGGGGLGALLGGLMGGGAEADPGDGMGDMAGLLGGLLGGGSGATGGGMGALLGGLMGGGGGQATFGGGGGPSLPFAGTLAEKLGISEQMANTLIMGAIGLVTASMAKQRSGGRGGAVDYNSLADPDFIRTSGVARRMSDQMGISEDDAIVGLQETLGLMATGAPAAGPKKATAKKATVKKTTSTSKKPTAAKKTTTTSSKAAPRKKSTKKETGSDFMDLLDDITR